ncbi:MAG: hypothetical protein ACQETI_12765 [Halobacteriota archaeon]
MTEHPRDGDSRSPLWVEADLRLTVDGAGVDVRSTGERLFVEMPSLLAALHVLGGYPRERHDELTRVLRTGGLTVEARVRNIPVAIAGAGARPGLLSRWVGVAPAEIRAGGILAVLGREVGSGIRTVVRWVR